jgi:hypothetical protein
LSFDLSDKERLLLEHYLPDTFFAFITAFVEKTNNYLIDEFKSEAFLKEYLAVRKAFDENLKAFMFESEMVQSWINLDRYVSSEPKVSAVTAYTEIGHMTASFNQEVNKLLKFHFPEMKNVRKMTEKELLNDDDKKKVSVEPKATSREKTKSKALSESSTKGEVSSKQTLNPNVGLERKTQTMVLPVPKDKSEMKSSVTTGEISRAGMSQNQTNNKKVEVAPDTPSAVSLYQIEFLRYLHFQKGHLLLIRKMNQLKQQFTIKVENTLDYLGLKDFLTSQFYLRPLMEEKMNGMLTEEGYKKETQRLYDFSSSYALSMVELFSKLNDVVSTTGSNESNLFLRDIFILFSDHLNKKNFYFVPTKDRKDSKYVEEEKPSHSQQRKRIQYGLIHEWNENEEKKLKIIKKGKIELW